MASRIFWLILVAFLSIASFGLWKCFFVLIFISTSVLSFILSHHASDKSIKILSKEKSPFFGIPKNIMLMNKTADIPKIDQRLTGSNEIDCQLKEILSYIVRDFLQSWYRDVSSDAEFINSFSEMCKHLINNFSKSSKEVNWISFFTQRVVEDFTSHLRLYRHTEISFRKTLKEHLDNSISLESIFFDKETDLETNICRESVCSLEADEKEYLQCVCDGILYLLLPPEDFSNKILQNFLREILASSVLQPLLSMFSDPDVINQNLIWLCKDHVVSSKALLSILRRTDNQEELDAFIQISKHELKVQNSKDSGDKDEMKKYMKSISFVQSIAQQRCEKLTGNFSRSESDSTEFYLDFDVSDTPVIEEGGKLVSLPFDVVLTNNIALHYFTQYLLNVDAEGYVFFFHHVEGFRTTVRMICADGISSGKQNITSEKLKALAMQLFDSYLGDNASSKISLDESLLKKLISRLKTESITESFFDEAQDKVYEILENEYYLNEFKDSKMYVKLLAELDLLSDLSPSSDVDSLTSTKSEEEERFNCDTVVPTDEDMLNELLANEITSDLTFPEMSSGRIIDESKEIGVLFAEVHSTGITHHAGRTFAVYAISVSHYKMDGSEEKWFVVRRYSEFYDFHEAVIAKYPVLASFNFPSKKPFNNLTRQLMEKRRYMLNEFIQFLLAPNCLAACDDLKMMVYSFLQPNPVEKGKKSIVKSVGAFVNPIKSSVRSFGQMAKLVPDTFFELKHGFVKAFSKNNEQDIRREEKPMIPKDTRTDDIPFRIMLLLLDEVFNLRNKDLWFRRRIMALLRQIIKTMQGGNINRKIKDYVQGMTSATQIAEWLKTLSKSIWPDGQLAAPAAERDFSTKMRTRIVAKMLLFCAIPDELKRIIGYETSYRGAMLIFNMFQYPSLNRRLFLVLLESFLKILFPNNNLTEIFQKFHDPTRRPKNLKRHETSREDKRKGDIPRTPEIVIESPPEDKLADMVAQKKSSSCSKQSPPEDKLTDMVAQKKSSSCSKQSPPEDKLADMVAQKKSSSCSKLPNFLCHSQPNLLLATTSPKLKKRKKSVESAIFYTELLQDDEDSVILPLLSR